MVATCADPAETTPRPRTVAHWPAHPYAAVRGGYRHSDKRDRQTPDVLPGVRRALLRYRREQPRPFSACLSSTRPQAL